MKKNRLEKLEAIRCFAALYVVFFHMLPQKIYFCGINIGVLFRFGPEAVIVFFVLSGFVIKYTYEKSKDKSFSFYFIRRFIRFYVPLIFIFLLGYLLKCYQTGSWADPELSIMTGNIFMLQDVISQKPHVIVPTYMGNGVLWSLSYEWWFYMLFFFLASKIKSANLNKAVSIITVVAAASYLIYPFIINRLAMYFAIWWVGVRFADAYMNQKKFDFNLIRPHIMLLSIIITILGINLIVNFSYTKVYSYPLVAYPFIELRHFVFAMMLMVGAVIWKNLKWFGFDAIFGYFKYLAPCSYVIYISHHYLVIEATYLQFIHNKIYEYGLYLVFLIAFSYLLEVVIYERIKKLILG